MRLKLHVRNNDYDYAFVLGFNTDDKKACIDAVLEVDNIEESPTRRPWVIQDIYGGIRHSSSRYTGIPDFISLLKKLDKIENGFG
jgi:hypothetical protein